MKITLGLLYSINAICVFVGEFTSYYSLLYSMLKKTWVKKLIVKKC